MIKTLKLFIKKKKLQNMYSDNNFNILKTDIKQYFKSIIRIIQKLELEILISIPGIFRHEDRLDRNVLNKQKFNLFNSDIAIQYPDKVQKSETFFLSHYLGNVQNQNHDFYYNDLFDKLEKDKKKFSVILLNKTHEKPSKILKKFSKSKISRIIINNYYHPIKNPILLIWITIQFIIFKLKIKFFKLRRIEKYVSKKFTFKRFIQARTTLVFTRKIKYLLKKTQIKNFFTTFEGHSFEKNLISYFNKRNIRTFGYYFTVIRDFDSCVFYDFKQKTSPSFIFFTGKAIKKIFLNKIKNSFKNTKFDIIGYTRPINKIKRKNKKKCVLFCPEGFYNETEKMLEFAQNMLQKYNNINIIFRLHPEIKIKYLNFSKKLLKNNKFSFSKNTLDKDLQNSKILIYRGSSVCINAIKNNTIPIYLNLNDNINLDPLFEANKNRINSINEIKNYLNNSNYKKYDKLNKLKKYSEIYFQKFDYKKLITIVFN